MSSRSLALHDLTSFAAHKGLSRGSGGYDRHVPFPDGASPGIIAPTTRPSVPPSSEPCQITWEFGATISTDYDFSQNERHE